MITKLKTTPDERKDWSKWAQDDIDHDMGELRNRRIIDLAADVDAAVEENTNLWIHIKRMREDIANLHRQYPPIAPDKAEQEFVRKAYEDEQQSECARLENLLKSANFVCDYCGCDFKYHENNYSTNRCKDCVEPMIEEQLCEPEVNSMSNKPRIGLYGGSFDPIHYGHLFFASTVARHFDLASVILIPAAVSPYKIGQTKTPIHHRSAMVYHAAGNDSTSLMSRSCAEEERPGPSYTIDTVRHLQKLLGHGDECETVMLVGPDTFLTMWGWHLIEELADMITFLTATPDGKLPASEAIMNDAFKKKTLDSLKVEVCPIPELLNIRSTKIRQLVKEGKSIQYLTPDNVIEYIRKNKLYV